MKRVGPTRHLRRQHANECAAHFVKPRPVQDVKAEPRFHHRRKLTRPQCKGGALELRDHVTRLITGFDGFYDDSLPDNEATDFRNRDKAMITGSELQLHWQPERNSRVVLGYANVRIESHDLDAAYSESAPRNSVSLLGLHELGDGLLASAAFYYQDEMRFVGERPIGVLRRLDLRLAQRFRLADAQGEAAIVLQNVLGKQVSYNEEDSIADRIGFFTVNFRFR